MPAVAAAATGAVAAVVGVGFVAFAVDVGYVQTRSQSTNQTSNQRTNQPASKQTSSRCLSQRVLLLLRPSGLDAVRGAQDGLRKGGMREGEKVASRHWEAFALTFVVVPHRENSMSQ